MLNFSFFQPITKKWFKKIRKKTIENNIIATIIIDKKIFVKLYKLNKKIILIFIKNINVGGNEIIFNVIKKNIVLKFKILKKFFLFLNINSFKKK